jgi:hypothetical protein
MDICPFLSYKPNVRTHGQMSILLEDMFYPNYGHLSVQGFPNYNPDVL